MSFVMAPPADAGEMAPCCDGCTSIRMRDVDEVVALLHPRQRTTGMTGPFFDALAARILARLTSAGES